MNKLEVGQRVTFSRVHTSLKGTITHIFPDGRTRDEGGIGIREIPSPIDDIFPLWRDRPIAVVLIDTVDKEALAKEYRELGSPEAKASDIPDKFYQYHPIENIVAYTSE